MQGQSLTRLFLGAGLSGLVLAAGCKTAPQAQQGAEPLPLTAATQADPQVRQAREVGPPTGEQMQELIDRLQRLEAENAQLDRRVSNQYMRDLRERQARLAAEKEKEKQQARAAAQVQANANTPAPQAIAAVPAKPADPRDFSRSQLLDALIDKIDASNDPARVKALLAAALSVATEHKQMDPKLLDALDPKSRELVARFHQMLAVSFDELAGDPKATLTRDDMVKKIDEVFGTQPLQIQTLALCRRVDSYGVYEPFATTRFLAGQPNRVLVYVELENFRHESLDESQYEVRLEQSVELYEATGEATVWRQGPVELVDVSRNKRRDFFIVYPVDLPARLTAGTYRLKVRVADKHGGTMHEQTIHDVQIVADQGLVNKP